MALINTLQTSGDNVFDDTTAEQWGFADLNTDDPISNLHELIPYGKTLKVESFSSAVEVQQIVVIGGENKETIVAETRYKLEIHNAEDKYESHHQPPAVHAYSTGVTIPAADAARTLVYSALVDKVNSYAGNNVTALLLFEKAYTLGGATGNETPIVGEVATETTSAATARIMSWTITSGTFAGGDAAGMVWMALLTGTLSAITKTWAYGASSTLSGTDAPLLGQGIAIEDDAGYFISNLGRPGINWVGLTQGFITDSAVVGLVGVYALGVGSVMAALKPTYDFSKQAVLNHGDLEFEFTNGKLVDAAKFYTKVVVTIRGGDQNAIDFESVHIDPQIICYVDESNGTNLTNFLSAITTAAAK